MKIVVAVTAVLWWGALGSVTVVAAPAVDDPTRVLSAVTLEDLKALVEAPLTFFGAGAVVKTGIQGPVSLTAAHGDFIYRVIGRNCTPEPAACPSLHLLAVGAATADTDQMLEMLNEETSSVSVVRQRDKVIYSLYMPLEGGVTLENLKRALQAFLAAYSVDSASFN